MAQNKEKMDSNSDSGLTPSQTLEGGSLSYCLELHGGPDHEPLERPLLERGSSIAQLDARSRPMQGMLAHRLKLPDQPTQCDLEEDEDGFQFTAELTGLSRYGDRSLSPALPDSTQPPVLQMSSRVQTKKKTALQQTRSLDAYQMYPTAASTTRRSSVGASSAADKYRLSFVDLSDSSTEGEESGYMSRPVSINAVFPVEPPIATGNSTEEEVITSEERLWLGKRAIHCSEVCMDTGSRQGRDTDLHQPKSVWSVSIGKYSDLQYDNEEFEQMAHTQTLNNTHQETNGFMCEDKGLELPLPTTKHNIPTTVDSTHPCNSQTKNLLLAADSTITTTQVNTVQNKVKSMDHASFSPLYNMSVSHLQYIVQLLETKLEASSSTLIQLLHEKDSLTAENSLLHENIARVSTRLQELYYGAQHSQ